MKTILLFFIIFVFVLTFAIWCCKRYGVVDMLKNKMESFEMESKFANLEDAMKKGDVVFLKLYADWCGHCQAMKEDWEKLEKIEEINGRKVHIMSIEEKSPCFKKYQEKFGAIEGFPTIVLMKEGAPHIYNGERTFGEMNVYLHRMV